MFAQEGIDGVFL